jgi:hypothetical protein
MVCAWDGAIKTMRQAASSRADREPASCRTRCTGQRPSPETKHANKESRASRPGSTFRGRRGLGHALDLDARVGPPSRRYDVRHAQAHCPCKPAPPCSQDSGCRACPVQVPFLRPMKGACAFSWCDAYSNICFYLFRFAPPLRSATVQDDYVLSGCRGCASPCCG